jgi:hypothetical protein
MSTLALRRTVFLDGERPPDDYEVRHEGAGPLAAFTVSAAPAASCGSGGLSHRPTGGLADSLDEAKAAFRAAWERPLSQKIADEICST